MSQLENGTALILSKAEWSTVLREKSDLFTLPEEKLRISVKYGVPPDLRGQIWAFLSRSDMLASRFSVSTYYKLTSESFYDVQIEKDLPRTFPADDFFSSRLGQAKLGRVLRAYANYDKEVGYCQGMSFVAAILLSHQPEELAFWTLVQIMHRFEWRKVFAVDTPKLVTMLDTFRLMFKTHLPQLSNHFDEAHVAIET